MEKQRNLDLQMVLHSQCMSYPAPPSVLLEQRILELERLGLQDMEHESGIPSSVRQFAITSLRHCKPEYFITYDEEILDRRESLEGQYGMSIFSIQEALLLMREEDGPVN